MFEKNKMFTEKCKLMSIFGLLALPERLSKAKNN